MITKLFIPSIGTKIRLEAPWTFTLYRESRNLKFRDVYANYIDADVKWKTSPDTYECTLFSKTELVVDRIYIRHGLKSFDSVTFKMLPLPGCPALKGRFWAKLADVNNIVCEIVNETA